MALKLDNTLLDELGLGALPEQEKQLLLRQIYEKLEMNVGMRLADQMSNEQLDAFERFVDASDDKGAFQWLESNFPNYKDVVNQEFEKLKAEIRSVAPQILASAQQNAAGAPAMPPQGAPQPAGMPGGQPAYGPAPGPAPQSYGQPQSMPGQFGLAPQPQPQPQQQYTQQPAAGQPPQYTQPGGMGPQPQPSFGQPAMPPADHLQPQYGTPQQPASQPQASSDPFGSQQTMQPPQPQYPPFPPQQPAQDQPQHDAGSPPPAGPPPSQQ